MASRARITVVNDTESFLTLIRDALHDRFTVATFNGQDLTVERLVETKPDLLMIDLVMRGRELSGWDIIQLCRNDERLRNVPILVCSADLRQLRSRKAELAAIPSLTVLEKPFGLADLDAAVEAALRSDGNELTGAAG
jgi:DNA-binding response OmpR family regulator